MAKLIRVWDGTTWQNVGAALPYSYITINGSQVNLGGSVTVIGLLTFAMFITMKITSPILNLTSSIIS